MKECPECYLCFDDVLDLCPNDGQALFISHKCAPTLSDRYVLEKRLGKGGMGTVFKAKHKLLKSSHAIKIISPEVVKEDSSLLIRFKQEAILAASIHHPNVVSVTDFGVENEDMPYLVMEFIAGISLDEFLRKEKRISPDKAFEILAPIAMGIGEAHGMGITHRDLKPLNVMLKNGQTAGHAIKVLDFGLAKMKSTEAIASLVQAKTTNLLGSPTYMSPEQWSNEGIDTRTDIYSLGVIAFQMLAGTVPFKGDSIVHVMYQHLQAPIPTFASLGLSVAPEIESVIRKALAKEKGQRFAKVEEFLSEYKNALSKLNKQITTKPSADITSNPLNVRNSVVEDQLYVTEKYPTEDLNKDYKLSYLSSSQNQTLSTYFNKSKPLESEETQRLAQEFINAQNRVKEAHTKVSESDKLVQEFKDAEKAAENARHKALQAQKKIEEDVQRRMQAEMEGKLAAEKEAREKAEAEARHLMEEVKARKEAEERANALAKTALEAQERAEKEHQKAEKEAHQRQLEEGTRQKAEEQALKLAAEVVEAQKRYEEAKREAANEAQSRHEAEIKHKEIEEEIKQIAKDEAEKKQIAEAQAAQQIKEQVSRLEKQALEAEQKANEARLLAESEAQRRELAEVARIKVEEEARRLAEEIIEAQRQLEEAYIQAKSESEKRLLEEEARKKAEESARSSLLENQQNVESLKKILISQIEAAQLQAKSDSEKRILEEAARSFSAGESNTENPDKNLQTESNLGKNSSQAFPIETLSEFQKASSGGLLVNTSSDISNTNQIPIRRKFNPVFLATGLFALLLLSGFGGYMIYHSPTNSFGLENSSINSKAESNSLNNGASKVSDRLNEKMVQIMGGVFRMGRNDVTSLVQDYGVQFPAHPVPVDSFYIDRTEVTNGEYAEFVQATKHKAPENWQNGKPPDGQDNFPVTYVFNYDARDFAAWVSKQSNINCQLPTEEEWEYAARSGNQQNIYPWGNEWIPNRTNIESGVPKQVATSGDETSVGKINDMMGNVMEWTVTTFRYYPGFPKEDEDPNMNANVFITVRGVSFKATQNQIKNKNLLITNRRAVPADSKTPFLGFRLVCHP